MGARLYAGAGDAKKYTGWVRRSDRCPLISVPSDSSDFTAFVESVVKGGVIDTKSRYIYWKYFPRFDFIYTKYLVVRRKCDPLKRSVSLFSRVRHNQNDL